MQTAQKNDNCCKTAKQNKLIDSMIIDACGSLENVPNCCAISKEKWQMPQKFDQKCA